MKKTNVMLIGVLVLLATIGGYWWGNHSIQDSGFEIQNRGMKMALQPARKILYYRNPMGLQDTSPVAKKDAMGMDYVPVYEGGDDASITTTGAGQVRISVEKVQKLGVKTEQAKMRVLDKTVRASGRVEADERHIYSITPKFEGWIEKLYVNTTGELVSKGQPLFDVYSPELISAQHEYAIAAQGVASLKDADNKRSMQQLADASLLRLKNWDISGQQVQGLAKSEATRRNLTFDAPVNGIVLEKKAVQGMRFMPGDTLYQIADLSVVWVVADVFEQDIGLVRVGSKAQIKLDAYPDKRIEGVVNFVYPTLNAATRTVPVRVALANPKGLLKPAMFAQVEIPAISKGEVLTVSTSAVIDSGTRQIVLVQLAEGRFEPRTVRLGSRSEDYVEVLSGVAEGEQVVVAANFLIDAESNLKAALGDFGHVPGGAAPVAIGGEQADASVAAPVNNKTAGVGHQGLGILNRVNADGTVSITFEAIKTLSMQGMTMDFQLANSSLAAGIKPGSAISFELVERKPDEWLITRLQARRQHEGH
jgi:Cu(I)/Ag(I) efflux system membrane fusion protein